METTIVEEQICPYCGHSLDVHSTAEGKPEDGDISICFYCGEIIIFSEHLSLLKCNVNELNLDSDVLGEILRIQKKIKNKIANENNN